MGMRRSLYYRLSHLCESHTHLHESHLYENEIEIALHYAWKLSSEVHAQELMERNCKERLELSWEEFMSKYEQSSEAEKKMLYDKICPAVFHCVALLRHWQRNWGPSDDEAYIPDDGGGGGAGGDDDEAYVPDASDEDDDWAYNLSAEDVSDLEVDEVREALNERGLDVAGDDALVLPHGLGTLKSPHCLLMLASSGGPGTVSDWYSAPVPLATVATNSSAM